MPLPPLEHDRRYGELDQVFRAYAGQQADDTPQRASPALTAYLPVTWRPPGRLRLRLGEFYAMPDVGLPESEIQQWLHCLADHIKHSVTEGAPPPAVPATHWEWHARFPKLGQFLGGWFSQDMPDEFDDHDEAVTDYLAHTDPQLAARLAGELHEVLALDMCRP